MSFERATSDAWPDADHGPGELARRILEHLPETSVVAFDRDLRFRLVAGPALSDAGLDRASVEGLLLHEVVPEPAADHLAKLYRRALAGESVSLEYRSVLNGRMYWLNIAPVPSPDGEIRAGVAVSLDVSARFAPQQALRASEARFRQAFESAPIGMALMLGDGRLTRVNTALCRLTGHSAAELTAEPLEAFVHPEDVRHEITPLRELAGQGGAVHRSELRMMHSRGEVVDIALHAAALPPEAHQPPRVLLQLLDITDRLRFKDRLQFMADHDPLTGLLNRRGLERELDAHIARIRRYGDDGALLALDLDHFKAVNETLGHRAGDEVIGAVGELLREHLRESDVVARVGGDEFIVLLPRGDEPSAVHTARALQTAIRDLQPPAAGHGRRLTASVGIAKFESQVVNAQEMLIRAELAMYEAKDAGRDGFVVYAEDAAQTPRLGTRMAWVEEIRAALQEERLVLYAQPIVPVHGGPPAMLEGLLRMQGRNGEMIPPRAFLPAAERFNLSGELDRWVAERAIDALGRAGAAGRGLPVSINVSANSLRDGSLLDLIAAQLREHAVDPARLVIEITETTAIANINSARGFAQRLRRLGCRLALDDFGSGFGSFLYLKHLPFDYLKIDGEYVSTCLASRTDQLLIEAVVTVARGLGKTTIAEQTPDEATRRFLAAQGVDLTQSLLTGAPVPVEQTALFSSSREPVASAPSAPLRSGS